eukprot:m.143447 g.143447  ORF g.143447 m.143447 type:complete len:310 (-) comp14092_c1_seq1:520-1449(-)
MKVWHNLRGSSPRCGKTRPILRGSATSLATLWSCCPRPRSSTPDQPSSRHNPLPTHPSPPAAQLRNPQHRLGHGRCAAEVLPPSVGRSSIEGAGESNGPRELGEDQAVHRRRRPEIPLGHLDRRVCHPKIAPCRVGPPQLLGPTCHLLAHFGLGRQNPSDHIRFWMRPNPAQSQQGSRVPPERAVRQRGGLVLKRVTLTSNRSAEAELFKHIRLFLLYSLPTLQCSSLNPMIKWLHSSKKRQCLDVQMIFGWLCTIMRGRTEWSSNVRVSTVCWARSPRNQRAKVPASHLATKLTLPVALSIVVNFVLL